MTRKSVLESSGCVWSPGLRIDRSEQLFELGDLFLQITLILIEICFDIE